MDGARVCGPTLLTELDDDEDGVLAEEEDDNDENDEQVRYLTSLLVF